MSYIEMFLQHTAEPFLHQNRDLSGNPICKAEAKAVIDATWKGVKYPR
jgi:hypothetical protein